MKGRWFRFRSFWIFPILAIVAIIFSLRYTANSNVIDLLWLLPIGLFIWTLLEYTLHRFVFHMESDNIHLQHHRHPTDPTLILVIPELAVLISAAIAALFLLLTGNYFITAGLMSGIWIGFLYYETVHYRVHTEDKNGAWIAGQRRMHFYHHFRNSRRCFGVTTPIWDFVFRTTSED